MARYASKSPDYNRTVRQPKFTLVTGPDGTLEKQVSQDAIMAQFEQGGLTAFEIAQCEARFTHLGLGSNEPPNRRLSLYDTDEMAYEFGWDENTKALIEANLDEGQNEYYFRLERYLQAIPWPTYDDFTSPAKIAETVKTLGLDPEDVIVYERENKNREPVMLAVAGLLPEPEPVVTA